MFLNARRRVDREKVEAVKKAMSLSRELFANMMKKALLIYADKARLEAAQKTGDVGRTIDVVKRVIVG